MVRVDDAAGAALYRGHGGASIAHLRFAAPQEDLYVMFLNQNDKIYQS